MRSPRRVRPVSVSGRVASWVAIPIALIVSAADAQVNRGVSWGSTAGAVGGDSTMPSLTRDGRWVAFESAAANLASDDVNGVRDVFLADRVSGAITLLSRPSSGGVGNGASYAATISGDGNVVAFASDASNLAGGASNPGVYVYDRTTAQMSRVPLGEAERLDTRDELRRLISLSADGRFVAFGAYQLPRTAYPFIVVFDRVQGAVARFSESSGGGSYGLHPRLNAAGTFLATRYPGAPRLRVLDLGTGVPAEVLPVPGQDCGFPSLSDSGQWMAYECRNVPDAEPINTRLSRVYLHDRATNTFVEVSAPPAGVRRRHSLAPEISADGRFVAFTSFSRLAPSVTDGSGQVYRYDRDTGAVELISKDLAGVPFVFGAYGVAIDATGTLLALATPEPVDVSDSNGRDDVYLVDPSCQFAVSPPSAAFPPGGGSVNLAVATSTGCLWTAGSGTQGFFGVSPPRGGVGTGTLTVNAAANTTGSVRSATLAVAGQSVQVSQHPAVPPGITTQPVDASVIVGSNAQFRVAASGDPTPTYGWQISSNGTTWAFVGDSPPYSGTTSTQLTVATGPGAPFWNRFRAVASNAAGTATSTAARLTVVSGCSYSIATGEFVLPPGGGARFIGLDTGPTCPWTAGSTDTWLALSPVSGAGSGLIRFSASANTTGAIRSATMSIAGRTSVVRQSSVTSTLSITTATLPSTPVGVSYSATLAATGATGSIAWSIANGALPAGLSLSTAGAITGTPSTPGTAIFTVRASDSAAIATRPLSIVVTAPSAPVLAPAVVNRPNVTLTWTPPLTGPSPTGYALVASVTAGGPVIAHLPLGTPTTVSGPVPDGTYFIRVLATVNGVEVSSNEIRVDIGPLPPPPAPLAMTAAVSGSVVTFTWQPPASGVVSGYVLEAGTAAGLTNLASVPLGSVTSVVTPALPNGSYYVRVRAQNSGGIGPPSGEVRATVGPPPPEAPSLSGSSSPGGNVTLTWSAPTSGAAVTGYELHAGTGSGLSNIAVIPLPASPTMVSGGGVPPGTYYLRVVAASAPGLGAFSNEIVVVVR